MTKVVGITFKDVGKIYWFSPGPYKLEKDDKVVVDTVRGIELGQVTIPPLEIEDGVDTSQTICWLLGMSYYLI